MGFNLTTDDVWDERKRMGLNKQSKIKTLWEIKNRNKKVLFIGTICQLKGKIQKHFGKTAKWSKKGKWRLLLNENNYTISKL
jgi:hypothetical protein